MTQWKNNAFIKNNTFIKNSIKIKKPTGRFILPVFFIIFVFFKKNVIFVMIFVWIKSFLPFQTGLSLVLFFYYILKIENIFENLKKNVIFVDKINENI